MHELLDGLLVLIVLALALGSVVAGGLSTAVACFVSYGLLLAFVWLRVQAVDVAMTEAAIGAGLTGALLIGAAARLGGGAEPAGTTRTARTRRALAALAAAAIALPLAACLLLLPEPAPTLAPQVAHAMPALEVGNPITAVLLGFRSADTLLEAIVLLIALIGVWSLGPDRFWGGRPGLAAAPDPEGMLAWLARVLVPVGVLVALYLLWAGADHPGGKFQAATVLAAMWLLVMMSGLAHAPAIDGRWLRIGVVVGPAVFLLLGAAGAALAGAFLGYPPGWAKVWIVAIEFALLPSLAITLALVFAGPAQRQGRP